MMKNEYMTPGIIALLCAVLFPAYFVYAAAMSYGLSMEEQLAAELGLSFSDGLFLGIGIMLIFIYMSFKRILNEHHNFHGIDALLNMTAITVAFFHGGSFIIDLAAPWVIEGSGADGQEMLVFLSIALYVGCMVVFGLLDILMGIVLLKNRSRLSGAVKAFAVLSLFMSVFEVTVVLSFLTVLIYPAVLLTIAVKFLKRPEMIEVV